MKKYIYYNKTLNPKFWNNGKIDNRIREKLLMITNDFYTSTEIEAPIIDIVLTGSLANYNYNEYSDFDIHIMIDFSNIYGKRDIIEAGINSFRINWNNLHNITIQGHDIEVYIQNITEEHTASGVYSLMNDNWIIKPEHNTPNINDKEIDKNNKIYRDAINQLLNWSKKDLSPELSKKYYILSYKLKKKIHGERKSGLLTADAEFSIGNLVFKRLRNSGYFGLLIELINKFYDNIYIQ